MDSTWLKILIELAVLSFFGFLYYFWQRKRIIRNDIYDIYEKLDEIIYNIEEFIKDDSKNTNEDLKIFINEVEQALKTTNLKDVYLSIEKVNKNLPSEMETDLTLIQEQVKFHIKP